MEGLTRFDRDVLSLFVQHMPYENIVHFTALLLAESAAPVGRDALNASLARLCAARLLLCEGESIRASDEVKLAARARFWQPEGWIDGFFAQIGAAEGAPARADAPSPRAEGAAGRQYIGAEDFERARRYARQAKKFAGGSALRRKGVAGVAFSVLLLLFSLIAAVVAVLCAAKGKYGGAFVAVASFLLFPASLWFLVLGIRMLRAGDGRPQGARPGRYGAALLAVTALFSALHAAFFAALIPRAAYLAFGLAFVLAACAAFALYLFKDKLSAGSGARIGHRAYRAQCCAFTRCAQFWLGGADVLSDEYRAPAQGASAELFAFGRVLPAQVYAVRGARPFHIALASCEGISVIGFPRPCDGSAAASCGEGQRQEDEERNAALEVALLREYAARERGRQGSEALSWSEDGLVSGFVCLQGEFFCAKCSAPFFNMPGAPAEPEEGEDVFSVAPAPDGPCTEEVTWEPVMEESFDERENAEKFLRLVLKEVDAQKLYAAIAERY